MDRLVRARVLLAEAVALGVTIDDLVAVSSDTPRSLSAAPTVAEYVETVTASFSKGTAATYKSYWRLALDRLGERLIDDVGVDECEAVVADAVARAQRNRPGTDGRSARENCIGALRALFARAERAGLVARSPAAELEKPRRLPNRRRALEDDELGEVIDAVRTTSQDPDLDLLLMRFHLESGARREGGLNLRLRDLDRRRSTVWLREKFGVQREQPVSPSLLRALETHSSSRGAVAADDSVFRSRRGSPITRRRYNTVFDRARSCLPWAERTPVSAHVLRHTAITAVERHAGFAVAQAFAGHSAPSVTGTYTRARLGEVAAAVSALTGEPHPLADR
ncbi:MAG: tyrosine-type recombinase/integrase [Acidimicrobiia bacterium]